MTETKYYYHLGHHAKTGIAILLFLIFFIPAINSHDWENTYTYIWKPSESTDYYGSSPLGMWYSEEGSQQLEQLDERLPQQISEVPQMIIENLGYSQNNYPTVFFKEPWEQYIYFLAGAPLLDPYTKIYQNSNDYHNFEQLLNTYGKSATGVFAVGQILGEDKPGNLWVDSTSNKEIRSTCVIPDVNTDGINDVFVSYAKTYQLPDTSNLEEESLMSYFFENNEPQSERIEDYFNIYPVGGLENETNEIFIAKQIYYQNIVLSGDGDNEGEREVIFRDNSIDTDYARENVIEATFVLNSSQNPDSSEGNLVLLTSNYPKAVYYIGYENYGCQSILKTYNISGSIMWEKDIAQLEDTTIILDPEEYDLDIGTTYFIDVSNLDNPWGIKSLDNGILHLYSETRNIRNSMNGYIYLNRSIQYNLLLNASTGELLWKTLGTLVYDEDMWFEKQEKENFASINSQIYCINQKYENDQATIVFKVINALNGLPIAQYNYPSNTHRLENMDYSFILTEDNYHQIQYGEDNVNKELVGLIYTYLPDQNMNEIYDRQSADIEIQFLRIGVNPNGTQIIQSELHEASYYTDILNKTVYFEGLSVISAENDLDGDGIEDYFISHYNYLRIISGTGSEMAERGINDVRLRTPQTYHRIGYDFTSSVDFIQVLRDPIDLSESSLLISNLGYLKYYENVNTYTGYMTFSEFFGNISLVINIVTILLAVVSIFIILKDTKRVPEKITDRTPQLTKLFKFSLILSIILYIIILGFLMSLEIYPEYTRIYISQSSSIYWFFIVYPMLFPLITFIPTVFNKLAPIYADKIYMNLQKLFYKPQTKSGNKEYKVLVMHMNERKKMRYFSYISRSLLPLLIGFTLGIGIYTGLAEGGSIYNLLLKFDENLAPLTNPSNLGIWHTNSSINEIWVEIGKYARYMVVGIFISYILSAFLIGPAWLLDDAGVVYYVRTKEIRGINDIDSVSSWFLSFISGVFGITALTSWFQLFLPMLRDLDTLKMGFSNIEYLSENYAIVVLILALIIYPIFATIAVMTASNQLMEEEVVSNSAKLFEKMKQKGYDVIPKDIEAVLSAKSSQKGPWTNYILENNENTQNKTNLMEGSTHE